MLKNSVTSLIAAMMRSSAPSAPLCRWRPAASASGWAALTARPPLYRSSCMRSVVGLRSSPGDAALRALARLSSRPPRSQQLLCEREKLGAILVLVGEVLPHGLGE